MIYLYSFLCAGTLCLIAQVILDNSKLTAGHITSLFTVGGVVLSFLGVYEWLVKVCGAGATVIISNFGHMLYQAGVAGYHDVGILGFFSGLLKLSSAAIVSAIIFSFVFAIIFKPKD